MPLWLIDRGAELVRASTQRTSKRAYYVGPNCRDEAVSSKHSRCPRSRRGYTRSSGQPDGTKIPQRTGLVAPCVRYRWGAAQEEVGSAPPRFRTIQICPKDLASALGQA